jgi:CheY-like chemotaxis protein
MPRMDGWAFLKAYREIAARVSKQIAIYVLSSSISDADLSKAKSDPLVTDYIVKPMEGERFIAMLKAFKAI